MTVEWWRGWEAKVEGGRRWEKRISMEASKASLYGVGSTEEVPVLYFTARCDTVRYLQVLHVPSSGEVDRESLSEYYVMCSVHISTSGPQAVILLFFHAVSK